MLGDFELIRSVPLDIEGDGTRIGLYKFLEAVRKCPCGGRTAWETAVAQNVRRASPLPLPDLTVGKVSGNRQNTKLFGPSDIGAVLRLPETTMTLVPAGRWSQNWTFFGGGW
jgi:hypothetical protein